MNVGLFADCYWPTRSGVVTSMVQLKEGLQARGHRVVIGAVAHPGAREKSVDAHLFPSLPFNRASGFRLAVVTPGAVARFLAAERLDLVHTHTEFGIGWAARCAARMAGLPLVHTCHTLYDAYRHYLPLGRHLPGALIRQYLRFFLSCHDLLICPSLKARSYYAPLVLHAEVAVVGNGIEAAHFRQDGEDGEVRRRTRTDLGVAPDDKVIVYVGRLGAEKRVLPLLHALVPLLHARTNYRALFVGDGPARIALADAARERGVDARIRFVRDVPWAEMPRMYAAADLFATVSLSEVHPMTLVEAAACGVPAVVRRDPAFDGLVRHGYNGYLVDRDNDLATWAVRILDEPARQRAFAANALAVAGGLGADKHVETIESLYRRLLPPGAR